MNDAGPDLHCAKHPDARNVLECRQCGRPVCSQCRVFRYTGSLGLPVCKRCDARLRWKHKIWGLGSVGGIAVAIVVVLLLAGLMSGVPFGIYGEPYGDDDMEMMGDAALPPLDVQRVRGVTVRVRTSASIVFGTTARPATLVVVTIHNTSDQSIALRPTPRTDFGGADLRYVGLRFGMWKVSTVSDELPVARAWIADEIDESTIRSLAGRSRRRYSLPDVERRIGTATTLAPRSKENVVLLITAADYDTDRPPSADQLRFVRFRTLIDFERAVDVVARVVPTRRMTRT